MLSCEQSQGPSMTLQTSNYSEISSIAPAKKRVFLTGGAGFFGSILKKRLIREGHTVVSLDIESDPEVLPGLTSIRGDLRDAALLQSIFAQNKFDAVYHVAAQLAHGFTVNEKLLWTSNVDGTSLLAEIASAAGVRPFIFLSTNCLWGTNLSRAIREDLDQPEPVEVYGRSKLAAELLLEGFQDRLDVVVLRCPTIMDEGRLGLLAILYEFIDDNRTVWVVGGGQNRYQFIYADDLATACILASDYGRSALFHIGSDNVKTMREVYESVIRWSGSRSKVRALPKDATLWLMRIAHKLHLSPLGPYHYKMIAESFLFDTTKIKSHLGWQPTLTNEEMLLLAYRYYSANRQEITRRANVSAHRKPSDMGVIRILKWLS